MSRDDIGGTTDESYFTENNRSEKFDDNTTLQKWKDGTIAAPDYEGAYDESVRQGNEKKQG